MTEYLPKIHQLQQGRVIYVYQGDLLFVETGNTGHKVRVAGVHTPERGNDLWKESKQYTIDCVLGRWIGLENHRQQWDVYGHRIASIWFGENFYRNLGIELLENSLGNIESNKIPSSSYLLKSYHPRGFITGESSKDLESHIIPLTENYEIDRILTSGEG